jgi:hypothetical protein
MSDAETRREQNTETVAATHGLRVSVPAPSDAVSASVHATPSARRRLAHLLIAKSVAEALFVGALAAGFFYFAFNPYFRGTLDQADAKTISGWVVDDSRPSARVEVQLYVDGRFAASGVADRARPDVLAAGRAQDERHGFVFDSATTASGEHEARVYAVHESGGGARRTLQLVGQPLRFSVAP